MFTTTMWNLLIIEPFFIELKKKPRLKTMFDSRGVLGIVGKPSPSLI